jgi:alpha-beta hydrolase superfamily lysophospholipase
MHCAGMGEYCERYEGVADTLTKQGLAVFALDHQGHGKSGEGYECTQYVNIHGTHKDSRGSMIRYM